MVKLANAAKSLIEIKTEKCSRFNKEEIDDRWVGDLGCAKAQMD